MRKVPKLRFKEFNEEWEEKKLNEITKINPKISKLPEKFIYIDLESVEKNKLKEKKIILKKEAPSRAKRIVEKNDILYQTVRPYQQNNLYFSIKDDNFKYVASTGYAQLRTFENNSMFVFQLLYTKKFLDNVLERCTGTSYPAINSEDLSKINIFYTSVIKEQEKIANFLFSVDKKISLTEEKLNLFKEYKKGIMQKIFSQELRFKDSNGNNYPNWEEKILKNLVTKLTNGISLNQNLIKKGYKVTRIETISTGKIDENKTGDVLTDKDLSEYKLNIGDLLFSNINSIEHIGKIAYVNKEYNLYHGMNLLRIVFKEKYNSKYFYYLLTSYKYKKLFERLCNKAVNQASINQTVLEQTKLNIPCLEEQKKIADFLSSIDNKIEKIENEVERLKEFKKGLLQQMFV